MDYKEDLTSLQKKIINRWEKMEVVHSSYGKIAKELGCSADTVYRTVQKFLQLSNTNANSNKRKTTKRIT